VTDPARHAELRAIAVRLGIDEETIEQAHADGTLGLVLLEHLAIPEPALFTQAEVEEVSGLGDGARRFWRALGFPDPDPEDSLFTAEDLAMLQLVDAIISSDLATSDSAIQLARVIGQSMQRIAQTQIEATEARLAATPPGEVDPAEALARAEALMPLMPRVFEYVWRRHLQSAIRRRLAGDAPLLEGPPPRAVGFADMVGFTSLSQELDEQALAQVVGRFETQAQEIVAGHRGRVVKMIGDEVMFEAAELDEAALIGLELSEAFHRDEVVSDIRVGIAFGPVLAREGDLYGPTVNLASRLVGIAYAGSVVTTSDVREALADDDRFAFKSVRGRTLKHIGRVSLFALRRAGDAEESASARARRRRGEVARRLADRLRPDDERDDAAAEEE
jgi:adenylate cyclase